MSIPVSSFETAQYLLAMAQQYGNEYAKKSKVPITAECALKEGERDGVKGYIVSINFHVPHAIADAVADSGDH